MCYQFEADRRSINITLNSFGTELSKDERAKFEVSLFKSQHNTLSHKQTNTHTQIQNHLLIFSHYYSLWHCQQSLSLSSFCFLKNVYLHSKTLSF